MYGSNDPLASINLSGVEAREGIVTLVPGRHAVYIAKAAMNTKAKTRRFEVSLVSPDGAGQINARFNLWSSSQQAVDISKEQLKSMLVFGGHPNPDQPFLAGVDPMIGLPVGVTVGVGKPYTNDKGETRVLNEVKGFFKLEPDVAAAVAAAAKRALAKGGNQPSFATLAGGGGGGSDDMDDEIPF